MIDPIFWLGLSILLVAISLTALLVVAIPAFQELGRAARSAEKLFDTLHRELPPTLEAIRLTGLEITDLTDDMSQGVQSAGQVAKQVDQSISGVKEQVQKAQVTTRSMFAGMKAAWRTLTQPNFKKSHPVERSINTRTDSELPPTPVREIEVAEIPSDLEPESHTLEAEVESGVYLQAHLDTDGTEWESPLIEPVATEETHVIKRENGNGTNGTIERSQDQFLQARQPAQRNPE